MSSAATYRNQYLLLNHVKYAKLQTSRKSLHPYFYRTRGWRSEWNQSGMGTGRPEQKKKKSIQWSLRLATNPCSSGRLVHHRSQSLLNTFCENGCLPTTKCFVKKIIKICENVHFWEFLRIFVLKSWGSPHFLVSSFPFLFYLVQLWKEWAKGSNIDRPWEEEPFFPFSKQKTMGKKEEKTIKTLYTVKVLQENKDVIALKCLLEFSHWKVRQHEKLHTKLRLSLFHKEKKHNFFLALPRTHRAWTGSDTQNFYGLSRHQYISAS